MSQGITFNLVDEAWIPVRYLDGRSGDVSLRTAFGEAGDIREIGGELPTQTFAITRLLLAILYRATDYPDSATGWEDWWGEWWRDGLPARDVEDYLDDVRERFDLFHPERPFFQVAGLRTAKDEVKDTAPLIFDLPSNNRLFTNRAGPEAMHLSFAEAARWLVNAQAFDASGIKSGAVGDDRVKGGKGYPIGLAWSGHLGGLYLEGDNLRETLLLNFVTPSETFEIEAGADIPPWEEAIADGAAARERLHPTGPVRLFTWQSRRIRLVAEGDRVVGCVLANGDALTPQNLFRHEPMSAWRFSEPQTKKLKQTTYMPREHRAGRAFWRGISALLPQLDNAAPKTGIETVLTPAVLAGVAAHEDLDPSYRFRIRAIGVVYGSNNSVVDDIIDDHVTMKVALLAERNAFLATEARNAVELAESGVRALRRLAENLARAAGGDGEADVLRAEAQAYAALDGPYKQWLESLGDGTSPAEAIGRWRAVAARILHGLGDELIAGSGPVAWAGREVRLPRGPEIVNTPRADGWYRLALHRTFGALGAATGEEPAA